MFIKKEKFAKTEKITKDLKSFFEKAKNRSAIIAEIINSAIDICISSTGLEKNIFLFSQF